MCGCARQHFHNCVPISSCASPGNTRFSASICCGMIAGSAISPKHGNQRGQTPGTAPAGSVGNAAGEDADCRRARLLPGARHRTSFQPRGGISVGDRGHVPNAGRHLSLQNVRPLCQLSAPPTRSRGISAPGPQYRPDLDLARSQRRLRCVPLGIGAALHQGREARPPTHKRPRRSRGHVPRLDAFMMPLW